MVVVVDVYGPTSITLEGHDVLAVRCGSNPLGG